MGGEPVAASFIVLTDEEKLAVLRIDLDKDAQEALEFITRVLAPKIREKSPCLSNELYRAQR